MNVERDFGRVYYTAINNVLHKIIVVDEVAVGQDDCDVIVTYRPAASNAAWSGETRWNSENMTSPAEARAAGLLQ